MIPKKEERQKTLVEAFIEGFNRDYARPDQVTNFFRSLSEYFLSVLDSVNSYDEWHEQLAGLNVVLVKAVERKIGRILPSYEPGKWCNLGGSRFLAIANPAELDSDELMLVPEKTIEKLIVLGELKP